MKKIWYAEEVNGEPFFRFRKIPLFFLKNIERVRFEDSEGIFFGCYAQFSNLRIWARFWLWLKKNSEIKVW